MRQNKLIISAAIAFLTIIALVVLTSSSSAGKLAPTDNKTCSKTQVKECQANTIDQEIIHESMSRQFLQILIY